MDHNDFDFETDFIEPLLEFFKQINLHMEQVDDSIYDGLNFDDDYFFPPPNIVEFERGLIKSSIIWDIIEERNTKKRALLIS